MHTVLSLLIRAGDFWWVNDKLGEEDGWLKAKVVSKKDQMRPPVKGWRYGDANGKTHSIPTMEQIWSKCGANCARWLLCLLSLIFIVVSTGVLLVGSWLAADKASFIK